MVLRILLLIVLHVSISTSIMAAENTKMTTQIFRGLEAQYNKRGVSETRKTEILNEMANASPAAKDHPADKMAAKLAREFAAMRGVFAGQPVAAAAPLAPEEEIEEEIAPTPTPTRPGERVEGPTPAPAVQPRRPAINIPARPALRPVPVEQKINAEERKKAEAVRLRPAPRVEREVERKRVEAAPAPAVRLKPTPVIEREAKRTAEAPTRPPLRRVELPELPAAPTPIRPAPAVAPKVVPAHPEPVEGPTPPAPPITAETGRAKIPTAKKGRKVAIPEKPKATIKRGVTPEIEPEVAGQLPAAPIEGITRPLPPAGQAPQAPGAAPRRQAPPAPPVQIERGKIPQAEIPIQVGKPAPIPAQVVKITPAIAPEIAVPTAAPIITPEFARELPAVPTTGVTRPVPPAGQAPQAPGAAPRRLPPAAPPIEIERKEMAQPSAAPIVIQQPRLAPTGVVVAPEMPSGGPELAVTQTPLAPSQSELIEAHKKGAPPAPNRPAPAPAEKQQRAQFENLRSRFFDAVAAGDEKTMNAVYAQADEVFRKLGTIPEPEKEALLNAMNYAIGKIGAAEHHRPLEQIQASVEKKRAAWDQFELLTTNFFTARDAGNLSEMRTILAQAEKAFTQLKLVPQAERDARLEEMRKEIDKMEQHAPAQPMPPAGQIQPSQAGVIRAPTPKAPKHAKLEVAIPEEESEGLPAAPATITPVSKPAPAEEKAAAAQTPTTPKAPSPTASTLAKEEVSAEEKAKVIGESNVEKVNELYNKLRTISEDSYDIYGWQERKHIKSEKVLEEWDKLVDQARELAGEIESIDRATIDPDAKKITSVNVMYAPRLVAETERNLNRFKDFLKAKLAAIELYKKALVSKNIAPNAHDVNRWEERLATAKEKADPINKIMQEIVAAPKAGGAKKELPIVARARGVIKILDKAQRTIEQNINKAKAEMRLVDLEKLAQQAQAIKTWSPDLIKRWNQNYSDAIALSDAIQLLAKGLPEEADFLRRATTAIEILAAKIPGLQGTLKKGKTMPASAPGLGLGGQAEQKAEAASEQVSNAQLLATYIPLLRLGDKRDEEQNKKFQQLSAQLAARLPEHARDEKGLIKLSQDLVEQIEKLQNDSLSFREWRMAQKPAKNAQETIDAWEKELIPNAEKNIAMLEVLSTQGIGSAMAPVSSRAMLDLARDRLKKYKEIVRGEQEHMRLNEQTEKAIEATDSTELQKLSELLARHPLRRSPIEHLNRLYNELYERVLSWKEFYELKGRFEQAQLIDDKMKQYDEMNKVYTQAAEIFPKFKERSLPKIRWEALLNFMKRTVDRAGKEVVKEKEAKIRQAMKPPVAGKREAIAKPVTKAK